MIDQNIRGKYPKVLRIWHCEITRVPRTVPDCSFVSPAPRWRYYVKIHVIKDKAAALNRNNFSLNNIHEWRIGQDMDISGQAHPHWADCSWHPRRKYSHLRGIYTVCQEQPQTASVDCGAAVNSFWLAKDLKWNIHNYGWHQTQVSDPPQQKGTTDCGHSTDGLWSTSSSASSIVGGRTSGTSLHMVTTGNRAFPSPHVNSLLDIIQWPAEEHLLEWQMSISKQWVHNEDILLTEKSRIQYCSISPSVTGEWSSKNEYQIP